VRAVVGGVCWAPGDAAVGTELRLLPAGEDEELQGEPLAVLPMGGGGPRSVQKHLG
jgi:hypothetical protein